MKEIVFLDPNAGLWSCSDCDEDDQVSALNREGESMPPWPTPLVSYPGIVPWRLPYGMIRSRKVYKASFIRRVVTGT